MDPLVTRFEGLLNRMEGMLRGEEQKTQKPEQKHEHQEGRPVDKTALFAEISKKGTGITKDLKVVDKSAKPAEATKPTHSEAKAEGKAAKPVKPPGISKTGPNTFYENHVDANFVFKAEELTMGDGFYLKEARNSSFDYQGKVKNVFLERCENVKLIVKVTSTATL